MKKEFLVAAPKDQTGEVERTKAAGKVVFNPFRKWQKEKVAVLPPQSSVTDGIEDKVEEYVATFLSKKTSVHRRQTYISSDAYAMLARILPVSCDGMTIPAFLDNVLTHHLETHAEELKELVSRKSLDIELKRESGISISPKDKAGEYAAVFLTWRGSVHRKQTYISHDSYTTLSRILPLLNDGMTVPVFLDNVLADHLETHMKELKELVDRHTRNMKF